MAKKVRSARAARREGGDSAAGSSSPVAPPIELVRGLAEVLTEHGLSEVVYETADTSITLRRGGGAAPPPAPLAFGHVAPAAAAPLATTSTAAASTASVAAEDKGHQVTSPFVGTFYRKPNPDSANYVDVGDRVQKGQTLCIIEAMKLMNEIEADVSGVVSGILAEDGASVEYGQPLFRITAGA